MNDSSGITQSSIAPRSELPSSRVATAPCKVQDDTLVSIKEVGYERIDST